MIDPHLYMLFDMQVTLNMDTVNFLGISIVGQSNQVMTEVVVKMMEINEMVIMTRIKIKIINSR